VKRYDVLLTEHAERDLEDIHEYLTESDSEASARHVLDRVLEVVQRLSTTPERGSHPRELLALGIKEYRQAFFKPYRLIYRIVDGKVIVFLIADGRRNMQTLLLRRLLNP
jgi:toxin ParE1/3/4